MMKLKLKIAVAALVNLCTLSKNSSSFKDTCFLAIKRTKNYKLKILPAYFVTTNISVFLHFLLSTLFPTQKSLSLHRHLLAGISSDSKCIIKSRSEEHTSELQSHVRISYAVFCLKKKKKKYQTITIYTNRYT